jgi:hypothetical protein
MKPCRSAVAANVDAGKAINTTVIKGCRDNSVRVTGTHFNIPGRRWKVTIEFRPGAASVNALIYASPFARSIQNAIVPRVNRKAIDSPTGSAGGIGWMQGRLTRIDLGDSDLGFDKHGSTQSYREKQNEHEFP